MTSFAVVSLIRRLTGVKKVGHAGTLDPIADGVLPICLGQATRLVEHIINAPKAYHASVRLGAATDTYDSEGTVTFTGDPSTVTRDAVEKLLPDFTGEIQQLPPMYSALKHEGRPLYRYAREGQEAPRKPRAVRVHRIEVTSCEPPLLELEMEVGRGAYVRTIAHDLGELLGCGAHLEALTRTRSGPFVLEDALTPDELLELGQGGGWEEHLQPPDRVLEEWYAALLGDEHTREVRSGRPLFLEQTRPDIDIPQATPCRAYSAQGQFLAILRYAGSGLWKPERVFAPL